MSRVRYFFLSMNVLNGLLAATVVTVVFFAVIPFLKPAVQPISPAKETVAWSGETAAPSQSSFPADYAVISEQNLFHPERKIPPEKEQEKDIPKPDLFLYGIMIMDDTSFAFVEDRKAPYSTAGRGKRQLTLKKGESLGGYILSEIEANRIVLVKGEDKLVVMLDDRKKRKAGEASALPATPRAISDGTSPFPSAVSPSPNTAPSSSRAVTSSPVPGIAASGSLQLPQTAPASAQSEPLSPGPGIGPGIGGSGTWPPTRSSIEQTQQKVREGRQMRMEQMQNKQ